MALLYAAFWLYYFNYDPLLLPENNFMGNRCSIISFILDICEHCNAIFQSNRCSTFFQEYQSHLILHFPHFWNSDANPAAVICSCMARHHKYICHDLFIVPSLWLNQVERCGFLRHTIDIVKWKLPWCMNDMMKDKTGI